MKTQIKGKSKNISKTNVKTKKKPVKNKKKNPKKRRLICMLILFIIIVITIAILVLYSNIFTIKQITVINNSKISVEEIINMSTLKLNDNMFTSFKTKIKNGIKTNPYIENVVITKKINGEIILDIEERKPTYMLENQGNYVYINNQGYILENNSLPLELPIIRGYKTQELILGQRLCSKDLENLDTVIQIMETAKSNKINDIIDVIDITDDKNFMLEIPTENKTVQFGDRTNINVKILWIVDLISKEKGTTGEIIVNVPNIKKVYFREKV